MAELVSFEGSAGNGANINLNVPMPGTHTGRRLIVVDDIPDEAWSEEAESSGTPWSTALGLAQIEGVYVVSDLSRYSQLWSKRMSGVKFRKYETAAVDSAMLQIEADASQFKKKNGNLKDWTKSSPLLGKGTVSGQSSVSRKPTASSKVASSKELKTGLGDAESTMEAGTQGDNSEKIVAEFSQSLSQVESGIVEVPSETWAGTPTTTTVDVSEEAVPRLIIVQVYGVSPFLGDYGLGRTVKTFTLLPGEETQISTRTWRATSETITEGSSIVDSYDSTVGETFGSTLYDETTDSSTQSSVENWSAEAEASGNWGIASASVSASASGEYSSGSEEFAKTTSETVSETAYSASSSRQNTVTSSSEATVSTEEETVTERTIKNINVKRVLNFVFRELNQEYIVKTHLKDIRIAFANGNQGEWREVPLSGLRGLLDEVMIDSTWAAKVAQDILSTIATAFDLNGTPVNILESVRSEDCGDSWAIAEPKRDKDCKFEAPTSDGLLFYRFKRGERSAEYALNQDGQEFKVPGVLMRETTVVMRTDSVVVEALLGTADALDDYSIQLQEETIRQMTVTNDATAIATQRDSLGIEIVKAGDTATGELFAKVFPSSESSET